MRQVSNEPVLLAQMPGFILDAALASTPGDQSWVAVWVEIDAAHAGDNYPPSTLWHSFADARTGAWSVPAVLAELAGVGHQLRLVPFGAGLALVFLQTDEGVMARSFEAMASAWDGKRWTPPRPLLPATPLTGFAVAGTTDLVTMPLQFAFVTPEGILQVVGWNDIGASDALPLASGAGNDLAFALAPGAQHLSWSRQDGGIGRYSFQVSEGNQLHSRIQEFGGCGLPTRSRGRVECPIWMCVSDSSDQARDLDRLWHHGQFLVSGTPLPPLCWGLEGDRTCQARRAGAF